MEKLRFTTYVTKDAHDKLKQLSDETRIPLARYIQEAIEDLLAKYEKPTK